MSTSILRPCTGLLALALLAGCAAPAPGTPEAQAMIQQHKESAAKTTVDQTPDWFISPPKDDVSLYAPGTASSSDMQLAIDKAALSAKRTLADSLNGLLSSKMKQFVSESGSGDDSQVVAESEQVTTNLITETNLSGYSRAQTKVVPVDGHYRAYVLLQYPMGNANRMLVEKVKRDQVLEGHLRASKAFEDLEKDIENARKAPGGTP